MPKFKFETAGRDWSSNLHLPATFAAFDDGPDGLKLAARNACAEVLQALDVESGDRADRSFIVEGDISTESFSLTAREKT